MALDFNQLPTNLGDLLTMTQGQPGFAPPVPLSTGAPLANPPPEASSAPSSSPPSGGNSVLENLKNAWKGYIHTLQTDPNARMALMQTGVGLMQSKQPGQNNWDVAGNALNRGVTTLQIMRDREVQQRQQDQQQQREDRKLALEEQRTSASVAASEAQTKKAGQESRLLDEQLTPEFAALRKRLMDLDIDEKQATIAAKKAQAQAAQASARKDDRTDPNMDHSPGRDTDLQFTIQTLAAEIKRKNPSMPDEQVRAQATEQAYKLRQSQQGGTAVKIYQLLLAQNPQAMTDPKAQAELWARSQQMAQEQERAQKVQELDSRGQALIGHSISVRKGGQQVQAKIVGASQGRVSIQLPDGSTTWVPTEQALIELGGAQ